MPRRRARGGLGAWRRAVLFVGAASAGTLGGASLAAAPADWLTGSGDWTDPTKWSIGPAVYPNNGSPNAADTYDATVAAGGVPYTVTFNTAGTVAVHDLTVGAVAATVRATGGTLTATGQLRVDAGTFTLAGATLRDTTVAGAGGTFVPATGTLDNVVLRHDATVRNNATSSYPGGTVVRNGLVLDGATFSASHFDGDGFNGGVRFTGTQTLGGTGTLLLSGDRAPFAIAESGTLTVAPGVTVRGGGEFIYELGSVINRGTFRADNPNIVLRLEGPASPAGAFKNLGVVEATGGASLNIEGAFDNAQGVIRANGGSVFVGYNKSYTTASLGTLRTTAAGGVVQLQGTLDNANATLVADANTGNLDLNGEVVGGTLATAGGATFTMTTSSPKLTNLTLAGGLRVSNGSVALVRGAQGLTLAGGTVVLAPGAVPNTEAELDTETSASVGGTGEIQLGGTGTGAIRAYAGTLTLGAGVTVRTTTGGGFLASVLNQGTVLSQVLGRQVLLSVVTNRGSVRASGGGAIDAESVVNTGTIAADTGAELTLRGTWNNAGGTVRAQSGSTVTLQSAPSSFGTFVVDASTVDVAGAFSAAQLRNLALTGSHLVVATGGTVTATGDTFAVTAGNTIGIEGGVVRGGTLAATAGGTVTATAGTLDGLTVTAPVALTGRLTLVNTIAINATLSMSGGSVLDVTGPLTGTGQVVFDAPAESITNTAAGSLGAGLTVRTGAGGGTVGGPSAALANGGLISARTAGQSITVRAATLTNTGTLEARDGSALTAGPLISSGTLSAASGGTLTLTGPVTNTGAITVADANLVLAGPLTTVGLGAVVRSGAGSTVTLTGALDNASSTLALGVLGPLVLGPSASITNGTVTGSKAVGLTVGGGPTSKVTLKAVALNAPLTMANGGSLTLTSVTGVPPAVTLTNVALLIDGTTTLAAVAPIARAGGSVTIGGTVNLSGGTLDLDAGLGTVTVSNGGFGGVGAGRVTSSGGASKLVVPSGKAAAFAIATVSAEVVLQSGTASVVGASGPGSSTFALGTGGTVTGNGTVSFDPAANLVVSGPGGIVLGPATTNLVRNSTARVVTFGPDFYVRGPYLNVQGGTGGIVNRGTIAADPGGTLILANVTNQGTILRPDGSIQANGTYAPGGPVGVAAGATLSGTGTLVAAAVTNAGTIAPGNSVGTLTVSGDVAFAPAGGHLLAEVAAPGSADRLDITGGLDLSGDHDVLDVSGLAGVKPGATYTLVTATGGITGRFESVSPGFLASYADPTALTVTALPEPGGAFVAGAALLGGLAARRRRR